MPRSMTRQFNADKGFGAGIRHPQYRALLGRRGEAHLPAPQRGFFKKGYSITNLFSVLVIPSMINENSFL